MQNLRTAVHLCFDVGAAALYSASIAIAFAAVAFVLSQAITVGLLMALASFGIAGFLWGRSIWHQYRTAAAARHP